jgi:GT2 family glycosyltransferase
MVEDYIAKHPNVRYVYEENLGTAHARNRGIRESASEYVAFVDSDAIAAKDWLENILGCFDHLKPSPDIIGGKVLVECASKPIAPWAVSYLAGLDYGPEGFFVTGPEPSHYFVSPNMAFKRKIFDELGLLKTYLGKIGKVVRAGEETEFLLRAVRKNFVAYYAPQAVVTHQIPEKRNRLGYLICVAFMIGHANAVYKQEGLPRGWRAKQPLRRWVFKSISGHLKEWVREWAGQGCINYKKWLKICEECGFMCGLIFSKRSS